MILANTPRSVHATDPLVSSSQERALLARWPHLARPGPQAINRIPATLEAAIDLAKAGRPSRSLLRAQRIAEVLRQHPEPIASVFFDLLRLTQGNTQGVA
jgi:hypothetical protein